MSLLNLLSGTSRWAIGEPMTCDYASARSSRIFIIEDIAIEFKVRHLELTLTASLSHFLFYQIKIIFKK